MTIPNFTLPNVVKYPLQTLLYILLLYFVYKEFTQKDECADLRAINIVQEKRIVALEKKVDDFTYAIAVKSGIINQLKSQRDSTNNYPL